MRRSSIITIIILILVIIGLIVALVVTNLPQEKNLDENTVVEDNEHVTEKAEEEIIKQETPTSVALDNEIVQDMYSMVNGTTTDIFHCLKKGNLTVEDLSNEYIQTIAFYYDAEQNVEEYQKTDEMISGRLEVKYMDEAIKKVFGDVDYEPTYVLYQAGGGAILKYEPSENIYYMYSGFGGGSDRFTHHAITSVEEYSDKYIVTEKMVTDIYTFGHHNISSYYGQGYRFTSSLGSVSDSDIDSIEVIQDMYSSNETSKKLISKFYDEATEYKHTFIKNEDGSFYWQKTEIVK